MTWNESSDVLNTWSEIDSSDYCEEHYVLNGYVADENYNYFTEIAKDTQTWV